MKKPRTKKQIAADKIDLNLFLAIEIADGFSKSSQNWRNLVSALRAARIHARLEMHTDDRQDP